MITQNFRYNYRHFIRQQHLLAITCRQKQKKSGVIVKKRNLKCILMIAGLEAKEEKNSFECHCQ